jgi:hypothetical protein
MQTPGDPGVCFVSKHRFPGLPRVSVMASSDGLADQALHSSTDERYTFAPPFTPDDAEDTGTQRAGLVRD